METCRLLLFDLDGTLLRNDKTISQETMKALHIESTPHDQGIYRYGCFCGTDQYDT